MTQSQGNLSWDVNLIAHIWGPETSSRIISIPLGDKDIPCWGDQTEGSCPFKSIFQTVVYGSVGPQWPWKRHWKLDAPQKCKFFMWMAPANKLSTKIKLHNMGLLTSANCTLCHDQLESVDHLYLNKIYLIWFLSDDQLSPSSRHLAPAPTNVRQAELRWLFQPNVGQAGINWPHAFS